MPNKLTQTIKKALENPKISIFYALCELYNFIKIHPDKPALDSELKEINEIRTRSIKRTDINDHLPDLFVESLKINPNLIVELGVRNGESTFALEKSARLSSATLISVDINDCSGACGWKEWIFVQKDDIGFAKEFINWCENHSITPAIDVLFIDSKHSFKHVYEQILHWFPVLSGKAKVFFHDTNSRLIYRRKDGSLGCGRNYNRGVIKALEKYFNKEFNEKEHFVDYINGWLIKHTPYCNGLTILEKVPLQKGG